MPLFSNDPPIGVAMIDPTTGKVAEVWRIYFRRFAADLAGLPPADAPYWVSTAVAALSAERNLGLLAAGYVKIAVALGVATPSTTATLPATDLSGTVPTARLGAGLADATTFLRGDSTWVAAGVGPAGPAGAVGMPGVDGIDGLDGTDGLQGLVGAMGPIGLMGPAGLDGLDGVDGLPGPPGPGVGDLALAWLVPTSDETVPAGWSAVVNRSFLIASGRKLTVGSAGRFRVL